MKSQIMSTGIIVTHMKEKHYTNSYKNVIYINRELSDQITDFLNHTWMKNSINYSKQWYSWDIQIYMYEKFGNQVT